MYEVSCEIVLVKHQARAGKVSVHGGREKERGEGGLAFNSRDRLIVRLLEIKLDGKSLVVYPFILWRTSLKQTFGEEDMSWLSS